MAILTQESRFQAEDVRLEEVHGITQTLIRIANSTDAKDWKKLREQFADVVAVDLRERAPSQTMLADELVDWIAAAYGGMETLHLVSNHDVQIWPGIEVGTTGNADDKAQVTSYGHVLHRQLADGETLHMDCRYEHELARGEQGWKVTRLKTIPFNHQGNNGLFEHRNRNENETRHMNHATGVSGE